MNKAKSVDVTPPRKIRVDLQEFKPKASNPPKGKLHDKPTWVCHFCGKFGHICPNYFKLQATKWANKPKVPVSQAQDLMVLIGKLEKALNLYFNPEVAQNSNANKNSNAQGASKRFWIQKTQSNWVLFDMVLVLLRSTLCDHCFLLVFVFFVSRICIA